jgi:hypothetical protein
MVKNKNTGQRKYQLEEKRLTDTLLMKPKLRLALNTYGSRSQSIEPKHRQILVQIEISLERTMLFVAERFIASLIDKYGKHHISTADGGI